jgi:hypothetical protein
MKVRLSRDEVLKLYCYCREAERSIHRALCDPWTEFTAYYEPSKRVLMSQAIDSLNVLLEQAEPCPTASSRAELEKRIRRPSLLRLCLGRWLTYLESGWSFASQEACFIGATLGSLLRLLNAPQKPENSHLIDLRMNFCTCQRIIEHRCHGLPGLQLAARIDHFNKTEWLPRVSLADVLRKSA